jgi:uncharacterized protein YyaL (SSP411 family)
MHKNVRLVVVGLLCAVCLGGTGALSGAEQPQPSSTPTPDHSTPPAYTNRLIDARDPYLLLHAHNPVDWYPWGPEALARAKQEHKPIFLSIGYSTCYWCHVALHTLYAQPAIAALMNQWFVNIKVDREQRPDLDHIYMRATVLLTGHGGWPNNLFLTPDLKPFFAGSYFPPNDDATGRPGFTTILTRIHEAWVEQPDRLTALAERVYAALQRAQPPRPDPTAGAAQPADWLSRAVATLTQRFDATHGGFQLGNGTKFPQTPSLVLLLAQYQHTHADTTLTMLTQTLDAMALGGMYDQLGGGFHRYSTETTWSVPHFEKMLYDNAQLLRLYAQAATVTGRPLYRYLARDLARYLTQHMMAPEGGWYTAEDAAVQGEEGVSYVWTRQEISAVLGTDAAARFWAAYTLTPLPPTPLSQPSANPARREAVPGVLRLQLPLPTALARTGHPDVVALLTALAPLRAQLLAVRDRRPQPLRDDKLIVALNALAIDAFTTSGRLLYRPDWVAVAQRTAERLWALAYDPQTGAVQHEIFHGQAQTPGYLDDYALLGLSFLTLAEATQEPVWQERAVRLAESLLKRFRRADGTLALSSAEQELLIPPTDEGDTDQPSGTSAAVALLLRLSARTGQPQYAAAAQRVIEHIRGLVQAQPEAWPTLVVALDEASRPALAAGAPLPLRGQRGASLTAPLPPSAAAEPLLRTADAVHVTGTLQTQDAHKALVVTLTLAPGYHVNAHPASFPYLIPTSLTVDGITPTRIVYPPAQVFHTAFAPDGLQVYDGTVTIVAVLPPKTSARAAALHATVRTQACTAEICLPPADIPVPLQGPGP